jgi:hypothetical protein
MTPARIHRNTTPPVGPMAILLAGACLTISSGCVTEGPPTPKIPPAPSAPASDIRPTVIDISTGRFASDSDKNGYADVVNASVFLFNLERHPASLPADGQFVFELLDESGKRIAEWTLTAKEVQSSRRDMLPGPGYVFQLNIRDHTSDKIPRTDAQLNGMYIPAQGGPTLRSPNPVRVSIGKIR